MRAVAEGRVELGPVMAEEAYLCLGCRACETACPSGVGFGRLLERTRTEVDRAGLRRGVARFIERRALRDVLPYRRRLRGLMDILALAQRCRLDRVLAALLPRGLREPLLLLPRIPPRAERRELPRIVPAEAPQRGRVGFFVGCVMPELFGPVNHATVRVLTRNGFEVVVPAAQRCCGALHAHAGDEDAAHVLMQRNVDAFAGLELDALVTNSAGCGATLREAGRTLPEAAPVAALVRDVCEFLDETGLVPPARRLDIPGLRVIPHEDPTSCCGAAGIYNLTHPTMSAAVLDRKLEALAAANADVIASGNPGCLMQLGLGVAARGLRARVAHPVELLDESYR
jgi:glycolate oxidase iron-sulfur subunit